MSTYRLEPGKGQTKLQTQMPAYHIQLLRAELQNRRGNAKSYSLRSFASHLAIDPSALSKILKGDKKLSVRASLHIVKCLEFTDQEKRLFLASVAEEKSRDICHMLAMALNPPLTLTHLQKFLRNFESIEGPCKDSTTTLIN